MRKMAGTGIPNVYLIDGVIEHAEGAISFRDLDGLYGALARAIAYRLTPLTGSELRFLRKRLNMTQYDVARLGGKTNQIAAKWEKGVAAVPVAESNMLRLAWMARFAKRRLAVAIREMEAGDALVEPCAYVLRHVEGSGWIEDIEAARAMAREEALARASEAIALAMTNGPAITNREGTADVYVGAAVIGTASVAARLQERFT